LHQCSMWKTFQNYSIINGQKGGEEINTITITGEKVQGKLMGLNADKSPEPDGLHPRILEEAATEIVDAPES